MDLKFVLKCGVAGLPTPDMDGHEYMCIIR